MPMPRPRSAEPVPVTGALLREWALPQPGDDKHDRGSVLVVGGAACTAGAVVLAGRAALRAGAGQLRIALAAPCAAAAAIALPEALVVALPCSGAGSVSATAAEDVLKNAAGVQAVLI